MRFVTLLTFIGLSISALASPIPAEFTKSIQLDVEKYKLKMEWKYYCTKIALFLQ
ncbi:MAG: hypothetical protein R2827_04730 [Bdellovibrionales bacterium]